MVSKFLGERRGIEEFAAAPFVRLRGPRPSGQVRSGGGESLVKVDDVPWGGRSVSFVVRQP